MPDIEIVPLDTRCWPALSALFEEGGDPSRCWCTFWRLTNQESAGMSSTDNRGWLERHALADAGLPIGLVALRDERAIGWTSLAPRAEFHRLSRSRGIPMLDGTDVWSVTCFVIAKAARGEGLSGQLLRAATAFATAHGAGVLEAYPVSVPDSTRVPPANAYTGVESTFLAAGFQRVAETTSTAAGFPRVVVRLSL